MRFRYSLSLAGLLLGALFAVVGVTQQAIPIDLTRIAAVGATEQTTPTNQTRGTGNAPAQPPSGPIFAIRVYNPTRSSVSNVPQQYKQPLQTGDLPAGYHLEIRKADGTTVVQTQQDGCSNWAQDRSCKAVNVSFTEPDTISAGSYATYQGYVVPGAPNNTPNVTTGNITGGTNFCYKTSDLTQAGGTADTGTWDLICLNNVLSNFKQYNNSTGYGPNPAGGWEYTAQGPNVTGIHAFQYAKREGDNAIHKWIRTDMWVEFRGSGATPCPCKIQAIVSMPNTYGALKGGSVGAATETGYVFSAQLYNGATSMFSWGGSSDARNVTTMSSANFNTTTDIMSLPSGNAYKITAGIFPVKFSSTGSCPTGISCGSTYWIRMQGAYNIYENPDQSRIWQYQCAPSGDAGCTGGAYIDLTSSGSGTISMTSYIPLAPFCGAAFLDQKAQPIYADASGVITTAPGTLLAQDFNYLTQKSKATPPFITANWLQMQPLATAWTYYPGSFLYNYDINGVGDGVGDERIGYFPHSSALALHQPNSVTMAQNSRVYAASFTLEHMYHMDEAVGLPVVLNNGHAKNGKTYATLGVVNPSARSYPSNRDNSPAWLTPSTNNFDKDPFYERYGVWMDGSHLPAPQQEVLLRSGDPMWQFTLEQEALAVLAQYYYTHNMIGGTSYYRVTSAGNNQTRGIGWGGRALDQADYFEPALSPISQYLHDLEQDEADWTYLWHTTQAPAQYAALGVHYSDADLTVTSSSDWQWWFDDHAWEHYAIMAWRNEYANFKNFTNNYFYKQVIGRMDPSVGGCLWVGPARHSYPYTGFKQVTANIPRNWSSFQTNMKYNNLLAANVQGSISGSVLTVSSVNYNGIYGGIVTGATVYVSQVSKGTITSFGTGSGGVGTYNLSASSTVNSTQIDISKADNNVSQGWSLPPYNFTCPTTGFWDDTGASSDSTPNGTAAFAVGSLGLAANIGIANASSLYTTGRARQISDGFSCTAWNDGHGNRVSAPEFCFGPLGATQ